MTAKSVLIAPKACAPGRVPPLATPLAIVRGMFPKILGKLRPTLGSWNFFIGKSWKIDVGNSGAGTFFEQGGGRKYKIPV